MWHGSKVCKLFNIVPRFSRCSKSDVMNFSIGWNNTANYHLGKRQIRKLNSQYTGLHRTSCKTSRATSRWLYWHFYSYYWLLLLLYALNQCNTSSIKLLIAYSLLEIINRLSFWWCSAAKVRSNCFLLLVPPCEFLVWLQVKEAAFKNWGAPQRKV